MIISEKFMTQELETVFYVAFLYALDNINITRGEIFGAIINYSCKMRPRLKYMIREKILRKIKDDKLHEFDLKMFDQVLSYLQEPEELRIVE